MNRIFTFISLCVLAIPPAAAQEIQWQKTIGGNNQDYLYVTQQTTDGGYILGGYSLSGISGDKTEPTNGGSDFWIIKLDASGNITWQNTIGGSFGDNLYSLQQTTDGGYIAGGSSNSNISGDKTDTSRGGLDYWIVKLNSSGGIDWQQTYGGSLEDDLTSIKQTADGGYIAAGKSKSDSTGDKTSNNKDTFLVSTNTYDYWILKLDTGGAIQWQKNIGGYEDDYLYEIEQTTDGGYIVAGLSYSDSAADKTEDNHSVYQDWWIVKLDSTGSIVWQNTLGGDGGDNLYSVKQTPDGGYILAGGAASHISNDKSENYIGDAVDFWIVKLDTAGNITRENTIGSDHAESAFSVDVSSDGGFILAGETDSNIFGDKTEDSLGVEDYWVIKLDSALNIQWQNTIGGSSRDYLKSIRRTNDGGYIAAGFSASGVSFDKSESNRGIWDYWVVKLSGEFNSIAGTTFIDVNSNGVKDIGELSLAHKSVSETTTNRFSFSEQNGNYSVSVLDTGSFSVVPAAINYYNAVPATHSAVFTALQQTDLLNDFAFQPSGVTNDLCMTLNPLGVFRPGRNANYMLSYENVGTTALSPQVIFFPDGDITFVSSNVTPSSAGTDSIVWNTGTLAPFENGNIIVTVHVNVVPNGTQILSASRIEPVAGDADPSCNVASWEGHTIGSYDPNEILVDRDTVYTSELTNPPYLQYVVNFQNTGTDTAFDVRILNPVDTARLSLSTLEFVASSHPVNMSYNRWENSLNFSFPNILLPDSVVDEPGSHGFVRYRIKPKSALAAGTTINSKAHIYFDFNFPVETNTTLTRIVLQTFTSELQNSKFDLRVYPNPAGNELTISLNNFNSGEPRRLKVFNAIGKNVFESAFSGNDIKLQTSGFAGGVYFIEVRSEKEIYRSRFVIE